MPGALSKLMVVIGASTEGLTKSLAQAEKSIKKFEKGFDAFGKVGQRLTDMGKNLSIGLTLPIIGAGAAIVKIGSDATESENLFEVSFGNMAKAAREWSDQVSQALGLNAYELRRNAGMFNTMFISMGFGEQAAYQMSTGLTQLANDFASFYNLKPEEAFEKIRSGIMGETEPLKALGIAITETTVKAYAYANGIAKQGEELTEAQKIAARYGYILENTQKAQGDLARTGGEVANQARRTSSSLQELAASLYKNLEPSIKAILTKINEWIVGLKKIIPEQQKMVLIIAGIAALIGPLTIGIGLLIKSVQVWAVAIKTVTTVMNALRIAILTNPIGLLVTAIIAVIAAIVGLALAWHNNWFGIREKTRAVAEAISSYFNQMVTNIAIGFNTMKAKVFGLIGRILDAVVPIAKVLPDTMQQAFEKARAAVADKSEDINLHLQELQLKSAVAAEKTGEAMGDLKEAFSSWKTPGKIEGPETGEVSGFDYSKLSNDLIPFQEQNKKVAKETREAWEIALDSLQSKLKSIQAQGQLKEIDLFNASEAEKLTSKLDNLNQQYGVQQQIVEHLKATTEGFGKSTSKEAADAADKYAAESKTLNDLAAQINDTNLELRKQSWITDKARESIEILNAEHEKAASILSIEAGKLDEMHLKQGQLNEKLNAQRALVNDLTNEYNAIKAAKGADAEVTRKAYMEMIKAQTEEARIRKEIRDTNAAIADQSKTLKELAADVTKVEKKYKEDLAAALTEYQGKVKETNAKLAEDEKKLTQEYENQVDQRAKALRDFAGLFDEVTPKEVSGSQLLANLQGQVKTFEDWSKNIQALAARGVDQGLIAELKEMGPKAAPEIAALNTLTDEQLGQYVALWRTKNEEARAEAVTQLEQQKIEMQQKLIEIQVAAAEQLTIYEAEWKKKNAEIRANAETEMKRISDKFIEVAGAGTKYGTELISNFSAGMESQFDQALEKLRKFAQDVEDLMPAHSPAKKGPFANLEKWGSNFFKEIFKGMDSMVPNLKADLSAISPDLLSAIRSPVVNVATPAVAMATGGNTTFNITISGSNADEIWNKFERKLALKGWR